MSRDFAVIRLAEEQAPQRGNQHLYQLGDDVLELSGLQSLVQLVSVTLITQRGSHILDRGWGGSIREILGTPYGSREDLRASVVVALAQVRDQITMRQVGERVPDDERLAGLKLESMYTDSVGLNIVVRIENAAGAAATINSGDFFA